MKPSFAVLSLVVACALLPGVSQAQTITVADEAQLRTAIGNAPPGATIVMSANITLTADLPTITTDLTFDGNGHTLSGNNQYRGLFVGGNVSGDPVTVTVAVQNVTIADTLAQGGNGGSGSAGGGGGGGLGGALFVASFATVDLKDVNIISNRAIGGGGGAVDLSVGGGGGGGGGLGGNGGAGATAIGGGGGGVGVGANGGSNGSAGGAGILSGGAGPGGTAGSTPGGVNGGGGGSESGSGGAGGGEGGGFSSGSFGGFGSFGGGGGGGALGGDGSPAGLGGGGGGGGGMGFGFGGYAGGGGGDEANPFIVPGGFGGGHGGDNSNPGGGGGAGMGGGIFVDSGGTLNVNGGVTINGNTATAGAGAGAGAPGSAYGDGIFFAGGGTVTVTTAAGETTTIGDRIGDEYGSSGVTDTNSINLTKNGAGTLVLTGTNEYAGNTTINGGTLQIDAAAALGNDPFSTVRINDTGNLSVTGSTTLTQDMIVSGAVGINASVGQTVALDGAIQNDFFGDPPIPGAITFGGGGTLTIGNNTNSYSGGTSIIGNTTVVVGADGALGAIGTPVTLGDATTGGTLGFTSGTSLSTGRTITINGGGGTIDTAGTADILLSGGMIGAGTLTKTGTGTLTLGSFTSHTGGTTIADGTLRAGTSGALGSGAVIIGSTGTLDLNNFGQSIGSLAGAGQVSLGSATLTTGSDNTSTTYAGAISGTGILFKTGTGTLTLTGPNSYTGGTLVADGTLAGTTDGIQGDITNLGTVAFDQTGNGTYAGTIDGSGNLVKSGTGTVTLTGANKYTGGTLVDGGVLAGTTTSLQGDITNNAFVQFNQGTNGSYNGNMSGSGVLVKSGTGTVTLFGTNTYSGGTLISGGTLAGDTNSIQGTIQNDANLTFDQFSNGTYSGTMFGTGSLTKNGSGTLTLTGISAYTGGTTITDGGIIGNTQSLQGDIANNGFLEFNQGTDGLFTGNISGSGLLTKSGTGILALNGTNTYTGGTSVQSGGLLGTTLSLQGDISNSGQVIFSQSGNGAYTGNMFGTGSLIKEGTGIVTLTGTNTYTGGTTVNGGVLSGTTTSLQGTIDNNAIVEFAQNTNGTYAGGMSGTGTLVKSGTGTLTLTGANTYTGGTWIAGGTLSGDASTIQGDIQNDGNLLFTQNTNGTYGGTLFGTGSLTKTGAGTLTLTGQSAYGGGTTISAGTLAGSTLNLQGNVQNSGVLQFDQIFDGLFTGDISGTGSLVKTGTGVVVLTGNNSYTGGTFLQGGGLMGSTSSLQGDISNSGQVILNQDTDALLTANIFGSGSFVKTGAGTVTLTAPIAYTGGTFVIGGALSGNSNTFTGSLFTQGSGRVIFDQNFDGTFAGAFGGSGGFTKTGTGTLTLTGTGANTGGTSILAGGLVGNTNNLQGPVLNNGVLTLNQGFTGLFSGDISGSGAFVKSGAGTVILDGNNSYTGGTSVLGGALMGTSSSLQGNIFNDAQVIFNQNVNGTYAGSMSGNGALFKAGTGILTLSGNSSFSGGTTVTGGGGLSLSSDASLGAALAGVVLGDATSSGSLLFTNNSLLTSSRLMSFGAGGGVFDTAGAQVTLAGGLTGVGGLTKNGNGVLQLAGAGSYGGPTIVNAGTLLSGANNAFGPGSLFVANGSTVDLNGFTQAVSSIAGNGNIFLGSGQLATGTDGSNSVFGGVISGTGSLIKTGGGSLLLTAANTYSGGTSVLGGSLLGNTTSIQGNIFNDGVVLFDQNNNGTYAGSMSGSGVLAKSGAGILTLTGANSYTGGTLIDGGSVIGSATSLRGLIINNASLTFGGDTDGVFAGSIGGSGSILKTGNGKLTMNGAQPLTGLLTVGQGTLALNGSYGGSMNVLAGSTLRANGFIAGSVNLAGSLFALPPGSAFAPSGLQPGTFASSGDSLVAPSYLSIGQNLTAVNGSLFNFEIGPGNNPTILVGGTAAINGAQFNITAPSIGNERSTSFLALAALNGLSLSGNNVFTSDTGVLPSLTQDRNSLFVTLVNLNVPLTTVAGPGLNPVADAIDRGKFGGTDDATFVIKELTSLDDDRLRDALEQLAGELHATVLQTAIVDSEAVTDLIRDQLQSRQADDIEDVRWWGETACQKADFKPKNGARDGHSTICAGAGGVDRNLSDKWTIGGGGSYTGGNMGVDGGGKGDYQAPRAFGYAGYKPRNFGFRGGGSASKSNYKTQRRIDFQATLPPELGGGPISEGVHRTAEAEQDGSSGDAWSEIHDDRKIKDYTIEGMFGVRRARISRAAFTENGAISIDLAGQDEIINLTQTDFKLHAFRHAGTWRPFFDFFYRRELAETETRAAVRFEGLPRSEFIVTGVNIPASTFSTKLGMAFATFLGQATLTYEFRKAPGQQRQSVGFRVRFK